MKFNSKAKINLFLKITGKRLNGYHELESVFAFLGLADDLEVFQSDKYNLEISGEFSSLIDLKNNLFTKILDYFVENFNVSSNISIKLLKNIPVGAGLGGGSSNAACFMIALNEIYKLNLSKEDLQKISFNFGSDIAFFFEKKASLIRGIGDEISEIDYFDEIPTLIVSPKIHLSAKEVYEKFDGNFSFPLSDEEIKNKNILSLINLPNDLTKPATSIASEVENILNELEKSSALSAKMSGSGSCCFGVFQNFEDLRKAKSKMIEKFPDYLIKETKITHHA